MAEGDKIRYSDIIQPDNSIDRLVKGLEDLERQYAQTMDVVRGSAERVASSLQKASGATKSGRREIDEAAAAADRLERAQKELAFAMSETGKQVAWLKAQTSDANKATVAQQRYILQAASSYDRLKADLKEATELYRSLSASERESAGMGRELLQSIINMRSQVKALDDSMRPHIQTLTAVQKARQNLAYLMSDEGRELSSIKARIREVTRERALENEGVNDVASSYNRLKAELRQAESLYKGLSASERRDPGLGGALQADIRSFKEELSAIEKELKPYVASLTEVEKAERRLNYLRSEEGQTLLGLRNQIAEVTRASKGYRDVLTPLEKAQQQLEFALSEDNEQLKLLSLRTAEANREAKLQAQIANSAEGSYNRLAAQYALNKMRLNAMSAEQRNAADTGKLLEQETKDLYERMRVLQEATGNYHLSVGNYSKVWSGLGYSVQQVVRELPSAAVSLNTFFLAISNNIPIVVDEIKALRLQNKALAADGKPTVSVMGSIMKSLFSWQSALVLVLAAFSMFGKEIIDWAKNLGKAKDEAMSFGEALGKVTEELESSNADYGASVVKLKELADGWKKLRTEAEKLDFIKDHTKDFEDFGLAVKSINDADSLFVKKTAEVVDAFKLRAKAAAARSLAEEKYQEALQKEAEIKQEEVKGPSAADFRKAKRFTLGATYYGSNANQQRREQQQRYAEIFMKDRIEEMEAERTRLEDEADQFYDMMLKFDEGAKKKLTGAGFTLFDPNEEKKPAKKSAKKPEGRDVSEQIYSQYLAVQKKYASSLTEAEKDEYVRRRKQLLDAHEAEMRDLENRSRKIEKILDNEGGKYKALSDKEKELAKETQETISETILSSKDALDRKLEALDNEFYIKSAKRQKKAIETRVEAEEDGTDAQLRARLALVDVQRRIELAENALLPEVDRASEEDINRKYENEVDRLITDMYEDILEKQQRFEGLSFNQVKRTETEITKFGLEQERERLENRIRFAEGGLLKWSGIQMETAKAELEKINRDIEDLERKHQAELLDIYGEGLQNRLDAAADGSREELELQLRLLDVQERAALRENAMRPASQQVPVAGISDTFARKRRLTIGAYDLESFDQAQDLAEKQFDEVEHTEKEITRFKLEQERARWVEQIRLAKMGAIEWTDVQIAAAESAIRGIDRQLADIDNVFKDISDKGFGGALLGALGFDDKSISALQQAASIVVDNLKEIMDAEVELAEKAVEKSQERVDAAQAAYDAEVEARANGFANNVATAKKELEQAKKEQAEKQKILEEAQRRQEALDSITQVSSLVTASANLWSTFSKAGVLGPILATTAIAAMWGSFAMAKIKARQVTQSEAYGEGGIEFLEGGSHASGNDIDLGVDNRRKKRMRAEGGEALAIINKRQTRKYRKVLPEIVDSLNKGIFEDRYLRAFSQPEGVSLSISQAAPIDLSRIEDDVSGIRRQNETKYHTLSDGTTVIVRRNVKRIIRR